MAVEPVEAPSWVTRARHDPQVPEMISYLISHGLPVVIKADGLREGKGVFVCHSWEDVQRAILSPILK